MLALVNIRNDHSSKRQWRDYATGSLVIAFIYVELLIAIQPIVSYNNTTP
jgi:hypothetical protein